MNRIELKSFMKKYNLKDDTEHGSNLQRAYIFPIYPRVSKI